jgi:hypothetical protein
MKYLSASEYGKKHGVSKQRVIALVESGRIQCWRPTKRTIAIDEKFPWPCKKNEKKLSLTTA